MKKESAQGFSIIELLLVCTIVGIIAALAIPFLQKAVRASENGNTFATMRTVSSSQVGFFQSNGRFGRLIEINNLLGNGIGTPSGEELVRGRFVFDMVPAHPTDAELREGYTITATRNVTGEGQMYIYEITQGGEIRQIAP